MKQLDTIAISILRSGQPKTLFGRIVQALSTRRETGGWVQVRMYSTEGTVMTLPDPPVYLCPGDTLQIKSGVENGEYGSWETIQ